LAGTSSTITIKENAQLSGNQAMSNIGALSIASGSTLDIMDNAVISDNQAANNYGAILLINADALITDNAKITNNKALNGIAGGLYEAVNDPYNDTLTISGNVEISGNTATGDGGGIYTEITGAAATATLDVEITDSVLFRDNVAGGDGGAIWISYAELPALTVDAGVTFTDNVAATARCILPVDYAVYVANIAATAWTANTGCVADTGSGLTANGYNNFDIAYTAGALVQFNSQGGSAINSQPVATGNAAVMPSTPPTRVGYIFGGWFTESSATTLFDFATVIAHNMTLYAKWLPACEYNTDITADDPACSPPVEPIIPEPPDTSMHGIYGGRLFTEHFFEIRHFY
jgi:uncharacterized repeat protein (TIGR02543 family)